MLDPLSLLTGLDPLTAIVVVILGVVAPRLAPLAFRVLQILRPAPARPADTPTAPAPTPDNARLGLLRLLAARRFPWLAAEEAEARLIAELVQAELTPPKPPEPAAPKPPEPAPF